jgi:hypothetical protein
MPTFDRPQRSMFAYFFGLSSYLTEAYLKYEKCFFGIPGRECCLSELQGSIMIKNDKRIQVFQYRVTFDRFYPNMNLVEKFSCKCQTSNFHKIRPVDFGRIHAGGQA